MGHYISDSVVDMHASPDAMCEVVSQAIYGTPVKIVETTESWARIQTPDAYQGWIKANKLIARETPYPSGTQVEALWAHLYRVDDTTPHPPAITLPFETRLELISDPKEASKRWMQVRLLNGKTLWAQKGDFKKNPSPLNLEEMLCLSKRFLGIPYRWGGSSSFGFDCSGFTQMLYRQTGVQLPRDSKLQAQTGEPIERESLLSGDLLFFGKGRAQINHVGMFLGEGQFIHSVTTNESGPRVIQISPLNDTEWQTKYVAACRPRTHKTYWK